jgi:hypothetical protein
MGDAAPHLERDSDQQKVGVSHELRTPKRVYAPWPDDQRRPLALSARQRYLYIASNGFLSLNLPKTASSHFNSTASKPGRRTFVPRSEPIYEEICCFVNAPLPVVCVPNCNTGANP